MAEFGVEETRARLQEIIERTLMGEKIVVSTEKGNAVIVCEEDWDGLIEALSAMAAPAIANVVRSGTAKC